VIHATCYNPQSRLAAPACHTAAAAAGAATVQAQTSFKISPLITFKAGQQLQLAALLLLLLLQQYRPRPH
jgi:hypothetical protein